MQFANFDITIFHIYTQGLLPAMQELLPGVDQRFCVRHLYANFRKQFPGKNIKRLMWKAAGATHPQAWEKIMRDLKEVNEEAFKHLIGIPPRYATMNCYTIFTASLIHTDLFI